MDYTSHKKGVFNLHGWNAALVGLGIGGVGTGLGSLLSYGVRYMRASVVPFILSAMTSIIFGFVLMEIVPESVEIGGLLATAIGMFIGVTLIHQFEKWSHKVVIITSNPQKDLFLRTGVFLSIAVAIHNFPTGIAMGASFLNSPEAGVQLAIAMILHNIPEGLAIGMPLVLGGISFFFIMFAVIFVAVPTSIGTYIGAQLGLVWPSFLGLLLGLAVGTLLYVTAFEIFKSALHAGGWRNCTYGLVAGLFLLILFFIL